MNEYDVIVIGGGAAGMFAAVQAGYAGARVLLLEPNERLGKKLYITGKGRCNLTNACSWQEVLKNVPTNPRFLYSALSGFTPEDAVSFFESHGCETKVERGRRVFPVSDKSASVVDALKTALGYAGVELRRARAREILTSAPGGRPMTAPTGDGGRPMTAPTGDSGRLISAPAAGRVIGVRTDRGDFFAPAVILATGGKSYPATGSTGDGYRMAKALGHSIVPPVGSLVPLVEEGDCCAKMQGLALKNVNVRLYECTDGATGNRQQGRDQGSGIRDQGSGIRDQGSGIKDQGSRIRDQGSGIRDQGSGIKDQGSEDGGNDESARRDGSQPSAASRPDEATGNRQQATGNRQQATGNGQQATDPDCHSERSEESVSPSSVPCAVGKPVFEEFGELLFTHFGLSGPVILSASAHMEQGKRYLISIDLKPALDEAALDARILRDFAAAKNRSFENALSGLYPKTLIPVMVARSGIPGDTKVNAVTREQRRALLELTKHFTVAIRGKRPVEEAIVTSGGVSVKEIDPKTMESKLVPGLYFAGEVMDVDAYTGGFNLQIAWATAFAAAAAAASKKE